VRRLVPIDNIRHDLDAEVWCAPDLRRPRYCRRFHVFNRGIVLQHVLGVQLVKIQRISRGADAQLGIQMRCQRVNRCGADPADAVGREAGNGDASVVIGHGRGQEHVANRRALALEAAARSGIDEEVGRVVGIHLLQGQERGERRGDGADVVDACAMHLVFAVRDDGEVAIVVRTTECVERGFGGEEGDVRLEV